MAESFFDPGRYKWREVTGEPELSYKIRHDYTILGYDLDAGTLATKIDKKVQDPKTAAILQVVADEVHRPALVERRGRL